MGGWVSGSEILRGDGAGMVAAWAAVTKGGKSFRLPGIRNADVATAAASTDARAIWEGAIRGRQVAVCEWMERR